MITRQRTCLDLQKQIRTPAEFHAIEKCSHRFLSQGEHYYVSRKHAREAA